MNQSLRHRQSEHAALEILRVSLEPAGSRGKNEQAKQPRKRRRRHASVLFPSKLDVVLDTQPLSFQRAKVDEIAELASAPLAAGEPGPEPRRRELLPRRAARGTGESPAWSRARLRALPDRPRRHARRPFDHEGSIARSVVFGAASRRGALAEIALRVRQDLDQRLEQGSAGFSRSVVATRADRATRRR